MFSAEYLSGLLGVLLSAVFTYIPSWRKWLNSRRPNVKRAIMAVGWVVISLAVFGLSCANVISIGITCDAAGARAVVDALVACIFGNIAAFIALPKIKD
jgi:membrane associated rhomboid family serine protease